MSSTNAAQKFAVSTTMQPPPPPPVPPAAPICNSWECLPRWSWVVISVASGVTSALLTLIVYFCCAKMICRRCQQRSTVRGHTQGALPLTKKQPATRAAASPDARVAIRAQAAKELQDHVEAAVRLQVDSELKEKDVRDGSFRREPCFGCRRSNGLPSCSTLRGVSPTA